MSSDFSHDAAPVPQRERAPRKVRLNFGAQTIVLCANSLTHQAAEKAKEAVVNLLSSEDEDEMQDAMSVEEDDEFAFTPEPTKPPLKKVSVRFLSLFMSFALTIN